MNAAAGHRLLIAGEVLFDCFGEDRRVLGGAPFNVAWNLQGFGDRPLVLSAVGNDALGNEVQTLMHQWQMDTSALQIHPDRPTGRVDVRLSGGEPTYHFWENVAFDHLERTELQLDEMELFYQGSLAMRSPQSAVTIKQLRQQVRCPVFVDINVRQPYFKTVWVETIASGADHLKLNIDEFQLFLTALGLPACESRSGESADNQPELSNDHLEAIADSVAALRSRLGFGTLWLTAAEQGAACYLPDGRFFYQAAPPVKHLQDTVGAGDAFAAVVLHGIMSGVSPESLMPQAVAFAAKVCGLSGATTTDRSFYR